MNGVHDLGGMHGFGPVVREPDEPVFRATWEGRVQAVMGLTEDALFGSVHGGRFAIEAVEPVRHLAASYWERWLGALELGVLAHGLTTREELAARVAHFAGHPALASALLRASRAARYASPWTTTGTRCGPAARSLGAIGRLPPYPR